MDSRARLFWLKDYMDYAQKHKVYLLFSECVWLPLRNADVGGEI